MMLGVDVSKNMLHCSLAGPCSERPAWKMKVSNTQEGIEHLLQKTPAFAPLVVEPTGRYSLLVVESALRAGRDVRLAPPRKAKQFMSSLPGRAKTDERDGFGLALFGHASPLPPYRVKDEAVDKMDQLLSARKGLSHSLTALKLQHGELAHAREALAPAMAALAQQIKVVDKQIAALTKADPHFAAAKLLDTAPGIGPVTSAAVASRLTAKRFPSPAKFVAYIGLDIVVRQSGQREGKMGLSHQGDAELRRLLFLCAQANLRTKDSPFKAQYERERAKGLKSTQALCAVARKLAEVCWSLHRHGGPFDPARVYQSPTPQKVTQETTEPQDNPNNFEPAP